MTLKSKLSLKITASLQEKLQQAIKEQTTVVPPIPVPELIKEKPVSVKQAKAVKAPPLKKVELPLQFQKSQWQVREEVMSGMLVSLQEKYPLAFSSASKPLAIGIDWQIRKELDLDRSTVGKFMFWYTNRSEYLRQHQEDSNRIDLQGKCRGKVTAAQAQAAIARLERNLWREEKTKEAIDRYNTELEKLTKATSSNGEMS